MKKFWLSLGLTLFFVCLGGGGYYGFGTTPSFGQSYRYADPYDPNGYNNYYSAPRADPLSQLLYYFIPQTQGDERHRDWQYKQQQESKRLRKQQLKQQRRDEKQRERERQREREHRY
jgi:hypothetical protein